MSVADIKAAHQRHKEKKPEPSYARPKGRPCADCGNMMFSEDALKTGVCHRCARARFEERSGPPTPAEAVADEPEPEDGEAPEAEDGAPEQAPEPTAKPRRANTPARQAAAEARRVFTVEMAQRIAEQPATSLRDACERAGISYWTVNTARRRKPKTDEALRIVRERWPERNRGQARRKGGVTAVIGQLSDVTAAANPAVVEQAEDPQWRPVETPPAMADADRYVAEIRGRNAEAEVERKAIALDLVAAAVELERTLARDGTPWSAGAILEWAAKTAEKWTGKA